MSLISYCFVWFWLFLLFTSALTSRGSVWAICWFDTHGDAFTVLMGRYAALFCCLTTHVSCFRCLTGSWMVQLEFFSTVAADASVGKEIFLLVGLWSMVPDTCTTCQHVVTPPPHICCVLYNFICGFAYEDLNISNSALSSCRPRIHSDYILH